jgi:hypothetical protein
LDRRRFLVAEFVERGDQLRAQIESCESAGLVVGFDGVVLVVVARE